VLLTIPFSALGQSPLQCWDNSTRGLDSATALEFVKTLRVSTEMSGATAIVAIYQASQSIYDVFDKVAVLYEGRQIYFGEKAAAKEYFINMGFDCPLRQTTADFLTSITSPAERITRAGFELKVPHTPDEFAAAWQKSEDRAQLLREIDEFDRQYPIGGEHLEKFKVSRKGRLFLSFSIPVFNINNRMQPRKPKASVSSLHTPYQFPCRSSSAPVVASSGYTVI
jgi:ATP-binding cassette subfamily G (WHITE) protein 2 (PDR)